MRLYDKLLTLPGSDTDVAMLGGVTELCKELVKAQCFELSEDISFAASDVCRTKPSTLLNALDLIRAPYEYTWVEWSPDNRNNIRDNYNLIPGSPKHSPKRVGALTVTNEACSRGYMILAWWHYDDSVMINPLGLIFDWDSTDEEPVLTQYVRYMYDGVIPAWCAPHLDRKLGDLQNSNLPDKWLEFNNNPTERDASIKLTMRGDIIPLNSFMQFLVTYNITPGQKWYESFIDDLAGELPFVESFYLLLNSRNSIVAQERDDFSKLNNARRKNKKPPFREFITTRLRISKVVGNRLTAAGLTHQEARFHLVRGHFKVRRSGVYWWSPHSRGRGGSGDLRHGYEVRA